MLSHTMHVCSDGRPMVLVICLAHITDKNNYPAYALLRPHHNMDLAAYATGRIELLP